MNAVLTPCNLQNMVLIQGGSFTMGSDEGGPYEAPAHSVTLEDFWVDATPVTNQAFMGFVKDSGYRTAAERDGFSYGYQDGAFQLVPGLNWQVYATPERYQHPVVQVTWEDAKAYANWAGARLVSESEWEYLARYSAGQGPFPWGTEAPGAPHCNFAQAPAFLPPTTPVTQFNPNELGIFDLVGNVWQWCEDWFGEGYYGEGSKVNPLGPETGTLKVRRGGSWNVIQPFRLRHTNRGALLPDKAFPNMGFRCAKSASRVRRS